IFRDYRGRGFQTAIDDFGAGYAGLSRLVEFQPDLIKLDMALLRGIDTDPVRRTIVAGVAGIARGIGSTLLAEGVETADEYHALRELGIHLFQGYLFGRPALERLEPVADSTWAALAHAAPRAGCGRAQPAREAPCACRAAASASAPLTVAAAVARCRAARPQSIRLCSRFASGRGPMGIHEA